MQSNTKETNKNKSCANENSFITGLTTAEVNKKVEAGQTNVDASIKSRSIKRIFYENICTLFNAVNLILAIIVACTGSFKNMLFMGVIVCNTAIGIIQEIRSKKTTDKLSIVTSSKINVIRDGKTSEIPIDQIVLDDVIILKRGDQVPTDCVVIKDSCSANESLLTGESLPVKKEIGDKLLSGSFINSGKVTCRVEHVGEDNYASKITSEAKKHKAVNSEIMNTMNGIIKFVSIIIFPLGIILFSKAVFFDGSEIVQATLTTVSALVGMIPEGLILLTSTVLAVSVIRLAKKNVLVQQLYCIETLARVSVLCLDKTGTITTGKMEVSDVVGGSEAEIAAASIAAADNDKNETSEAISEYFKDSSNVMEATEYVPFSSEKKFSGAMFDKCGYIMGALEYVIKNPSGELLNQKKDLAKNSRVLVIAKVDGFKEGNIVGEPKAIGFICIKDQIRKSAKSTLKYFFDEGVDLKIISGDDPSTVSGIAKQVGLKGADKFIDATTLKSDEDIAEAVKEYSIFGRVAPEQKRSICKALQNMGHTVAMTGDGVNDVLALKESDCSVAMAAGSSAARNVSNLVLLDNDFSCMCDVVGEGRRSINNLQRSASLFLVKTLLSMALSVLFILLPWSYPFQPIQLTLISALTIGLPSFVLALEPNHDRIKGNFLENVIVRSLPSVIVLIVAIIVINAFGYNVYDFSYEQISTMCVLMMSTIGFMLIIRLSIPFTVIRTILIVVCVVGTFLACTFLPQLFAIAPFTSDMFMLFGVVAVLASICFFVLYYVIDVWYKKRQAKLL